MKFTVTVVVLACLMASAPCFGQISPEEAYQRLLQREKERAAEAATAAASQPAKPKVSSAATARMLHDAWTALMAHQYAQGKSLFDKVVAIDLADPSAGGRAVALEGRGICLYELREYKAAGKDAEAAYKLHGGVPEGSEWSSNRTAVKASRQLVIAVAAAALMNDNPMRAAKVLRTIMEPIKDIEINQDGGALDEELQNDLGTALTASSAQARLLPTFQEANRYYVDYDKPMNQQRKDGQARWGIRWIDSSLAADKWRAFESAESFAQQATTDFQHASLAREHSFDHWVELNGMRLHSTAEWIKYTREYKQSLITEAVAKRRMDQAMMRLGEVEKPPFPDRIEHDWQEPQ